MLSSGLRRAVPRYHSSTSIHQGPTIYIRNAATYVGRKPKREGNISDSFASMSGTSTEPLPEKFRQLKLGLSRTHEAALVASWKRLLVQLHQENEIIAQKKSTIIPQIEFESMEQQLPAMKEEIRLRGAVVIKGVIPEAEARAYKDDIAAYANKNPHTKGFPQNDPQVYELYWSAPQLKARGHPNMLKVQQSLMHSLWHISDPASEVSLSRPLTYADRLRIRQPGDASFALGPHIDGGSVERWEKEGYGKGGVYDPIFRGQYEDYDPWDASGRVNAVNDLYEGLGACTMFRMWQGWLSMSHTAPLQGTLLVNPLMRLSVVYTLLRAFFAPIRSREEIGQERFLEADNWGFLAGVDMTSDLPGAIPGKGQEYTDELHPHLQLEQSMVHIPEIKPGDFVAWHCDTIHAVDKVHTGKLDSSVLYIPVCPLTSINAQYLLYQREAFLAGYPAPDQPGGEGEARHIGRPDAERLKAWTGEEGLTAMGLGRQAVHVNDQVGERAVIETANKLLGF